MPHQLADAGISIGVDLVEVERLARLLHENPDLAVSIFTKRELDYCGSTPSAARRLASRFAAKEAVLKALGSGLDAGIELSEVEIVRSPRGRPSVRLTGRVRELADRLGVSVVEVSMSHTRQLAFAQALSIRATASGATPEP